MTTDVLEGLLTDRALGELSPEVEALLEAYLVHDAAGRAEAAAIGRVVGTARRVMAAEEKVQRGELPRLTGGRRQLWRALAVGGAMAACVAAGYVLGNGWTGEARTDLAAGGGKALPVPAVMASEGPRVRETGFWSVERLRGLAEKKEAGKRDDAVSRGDAAAKVFKTFGG